MYQKTSKERMRFQVTQILEARGEDLFQAYDMSKQQLSVFLGIERRKSREQSEK